MADKGANDPNKGDESKDQLHEFLVALATDPAALGRFVKDPDTAMADAELGPMDQSVLRSGDPATINTRLVRGPGPAAAAAMMLVVDVTPGAGGKPEQVTVRPFGQPLFPQFPPQQVLPQFPPQQVFPQIHPQQVFPQIHPQLVIHPQQVVHPQIHPQLVFPQIHPQLVFPFIPGQ